MIGQRQARASRILCFVTLLAGCTKAPPRSDENAPRPVPRPVPHDEGAVPRAATAEARVDEIMKRTMMARDEGTMAVLTRPGDAPPPRLVAALSPGVVQRLDSGRDGLDPVLPDSTSPRRARVTLPRSSAGAIRLLDTGTGRAIAIRLGGARATDATLARGLVLWRGGAPDGGDLIARAHGDGVEDYVAFDARPSAERLVYHVDVSAFAGVRLVDRVVEFLDEKGVPRLRMARPYVADASAKRIEATVGVHGCAVDTDPRPPYGRAVTPPGSSTCAVTIAWSGASYPVLVDPTWSATTQVMTSLRRWHTASLLVEGKVLIAGGNNLTSVVASAEVYDPASGTFATLAPMSTPRTGHAMGWRMVTGGMNASSQVLATAEWLKTDASGWITSAQNMKATRVYHAMAGFSTNGKFVVAGGTTADLFDIANGGTFTALPPLSEDKRYHVGLQISPTEVWMVGGYRWNGANVYETSVDIYKSDNTRTTGPAMPHGHAQGGAVVLTGGAVLVHTGLGTGFDSADVYKGGAWTSTPRSWRRDHQAVALPDGTALIIGHSLGSERYDPIAKAFSSAGNSVTARENATATVLGDGRVLVAGGHQPGVATPVYNTAEIFAAAAGGTTCASAGECTSLHCVEGVCCDTTCTALCTSCLKSKQGSTGTDGKCGPILAGSDPYNDCAAEAATTCGKDGACNGAGACRLWGAGEPCGSSCSGSTQTNKGCNGNGACTQTLSTKTCANPPQCADATQCSLNCNASTPCATGYYCVSGTCTPKKSEGEACSDKAECDSGACADGVCCNDACSGLCESCTAAGKGYGNDGDCGAVKEGIDPADECDEDTTNECGTTGSCDGKGQCAKKAPGAVCGAAACLNALTAAASACNGQGACIESPGGRPCVPYGCNAAAGTCVTSCTATSDCGAGNYCDQTVCLPVRPNGEPCAENDQCMSGFCAAGACNPGGDGVCDGDHTISLPTGNTQDCSPYRCSSDAKCRETCGSTADCTQGNACNAEGKCEVDTGPTTGEPGGCACRATSRDDTEGGWLFGALAAAFVTAMRRRRQGRKGSRHGETPCRFRA